MEERGFPAAAIADLRLRVRVEMALPVLLGLELENCDIGTVDGDQITPSFWHQCHQNLVLTFQPQVLKQLRDRHAKSRLLGFSRGPTLMHMRQVGKAPGVLDPVQLHRIHVLVLVQERIEPYKLRVVVVGNTSVDAGTDAGLLNFARLFLSLPNAPHAVYIGMEAIKHRIPSSGIEVTHVLIMRSPGVTHPSVDGVVGDVLDGPHAGTGEPGFSANGVAEEQQRTRRVGHHLPLVPSVEREEEPVEVDLIGLAGELISAIAVSAVDLSLIVEASLISVGKILHFLNGGLELLHVLVVYGVSGRPDIKLGKSGDLIVLNTTSIRDGRATRGKGVRAGGEVVSAVETSETQKDVSPVKFRLREAVRVFTPLRRGCAPDLDVTTTSCSCPAGVEKDLGRSGKVTGRRLGGEGNVVVGA
nr:hypothetical protein Iba_chr13fCG2560 [Ipomoea batatas]